MNNLLTTMPTLTEITLGEIFLNLTISLLMGLGIFATYQKTFQGVLYQKSFNVALVAITVILTFVIMIIRGNLVLSLGMIGALSIVRFRTPIKDPIDLVFIFWAVAVGIANGVGLFETSIIASLVIAATLFLLPRIKRNGDDSYLLILHLADQKSEELITELVRKSTAKFSLKSKSINPSFIEIILEVKIKNHDTSFINQIGVAQGVIKSTLITSNENLSSF